MERREKRILENKLKLIINVDSRRFWSCKPSEKSSDHLIYLKTCHEAVQGRSTRIILYDIMKHTTASVIIHIRILYIYSDYTNRYNHFGIKVQCAFNRNCMMGPRRSAKLNFTRKSGRWHTITDRGMILPAFPALSAYSRTAMSGPRCNLGASCNIDDG